MRNAFWRKAACVAALLLSGVLRADEILPEEAEWAVGTWLNGNRQPLGSGFSSSRGRAWTARCSDGRALYHVVEVGGGGFVVTSGDTRIMPIVCFSGSGEFPAEDGPLAAWLKADMSARMEDLEQVKQGALRLTAAGPRAADEDVAATLSEAASSAEAEWARLLDCRPKVALLGAEDFASTFLYTLSDVRVSPLVSAKWNQSKWGKPSKDTFNLYTPGKRVCGCVATAFGQVMRKWKYPASSIAAETYPCYIAGKLTYLKMKGGKYDWSNMPLTSSKCTTTKQRQALGKLVSDIGIAAQMNYDVESGTMGVVACDALRTRFKYKSAKTVRDSTSGAILAGKAANALLASLDAGMPVVAGIGNALNEGHEVVLDGYGFNGGTQYVHMNCGWSGSSDMWYMLMSSWETVTEHVFSQMKELCYNIHPTKDGDVISGRVTDGASGSAVSGAVVTMTDSSGKSVTAKTNKKGIYSFRVTTAGTYRLSAKTSKKASTTMVATMGIGANATLVRTSGGGTWTSNGSVGNLWGCNFTLLPTVTITFKPNGASGKTVTQKVPKGVTSALRLNTFKREGYSFKGWSTSASGDVVCSDGQAFSSSADRTLYAVWGPGTLVTQPKVKAADGMSTDGVALSWNAVPGATEYRIYRDGTWWFTATTTKYTDTTALGGTVYTYQVKAANAVSSIMGSSDTGWRKAVFKLTSSRKTFPRKGGTDVILPEANVEYYASVSAGSWLSVKERVKVGGDDNRKRILLEAPVNPNDFPRYETVVLVGSNGQRLEYHVTQMAYDFDILEGTGSGTFDGRSALTFDGYVCNENTLEMVGTLTVKTAVAKSGTASVTASVKIGSKTYSYKNGKARILDPKTAERIVTVTGLKSADKGAKKLTLKLDDGGFTGRYDDIYIVAGARRVTNAGEYAGKYSMELAAGLCLSDLEPDLRLSVSVGSDGVVKISGHLGDGRKVSGSGRLIDAGGGFAYVPATLTLPGKMGTVRLILRVESGSGNCRVTSYSDWTGDGVPTQPPGEVEWVPPEVSMVGVKYETQLDFANWAAYPVKITAQNLPKGLTVNSTTGIISGVPTKADTYETVFTVKSLANAAWPAVQLKVKHEVKALRKGAYGSFVGWAYDYEGQGLLTMSVTSAGKISGKIVKGGRTWVFSAASYGKESYLNNFDVLSLRLNVTAKSTKSGKTTKKPLAIDLIVGDDDLVPLLTGLFDADGSFTMVNANRVPWGDAGFAQLLAGIVGKHTWFTDDGGKLVLTVDAHGKVKASGKLGNGRKLSLSTTVLCEERWSSGYDFFAYLYAPSEKISGKKYPEFFERAALISEP